MIRSMRPLRPGMPRLLPAAVGLAGLAACGLQTTGLPAGDAADRPPLDDGRAEDAGETPSDAPDGGDALICPPATSWCSLGAVMLCSEDGLSYSTTPCPLGCGDAPWAHCLELQPGNISDPSLLCAGSARMAVRPETRFVTFETDTGRITEWTESMAFVRENRPEGEGDLDGIFHARLTQPDGAPPLGIFAFAGLTVPVDVALLAGGAHAFVLLSCGDATIDGQLFVGAVQYTDDLGELRRIPGPGGSSAGSGAGAGGPGGWSTTYRTSGGGGGGGFGGGGGPGGNGGYHGALLAGAAGRLYGNPELVPLRGGSGGGNGGFDTSPPGGAGGHGGGALQLTARGTLRIRGLIDAGGLGGRGGGNADGGGGGGGSGGGILLEAERLVVEPGAMIAANGGGAGSGVGYGAYGYFSNPGQRGEPRLTSAAGGADPGTYGCAGGAGSSATALLGGSVGCIGGADYYGGGGGGGAGRIRLNGVSLEIARNTLSPADGTPGTTTTTGTPNLR